MMNVIVEKIPLEMREKDTWCVWKNKIPYSPKTSKKAKANDESTFSDFDTAYRVYESNQYQGIGFGLFHNISVVDIDHCIDESGNFSDLAKDLLNRFNSYAEISPSGKGIHIYFIADDFSYDKDVYYINNHKLGLEVYVAGSTSKYITVTGQAINNNSLNDCTNILPDVLDLYMKKNAQLNTFSDTCPIKSDDKDYLEIGLSNDVVLNSYWNGNRPKNSESENDAGFMAKLLYWLNGNTEKAIAAFKSSPYYFQKDEAHKKKCERKDYLMNTVKAVMPNVAACDKQSFNKSKKDTKNLSKENKLISAFDLQQKDLPPTQFIVEDILPVGLTILAAPPKSGKSWFVLQMGWCVSSGKPFLNKHTSHCGVLYLALEDSENRLKSRLNKLLNYNEAPCNFYFQNKASNIDNGLFDELESYLSSANDIKLIIIDTLQIVRGSAQYGETQYERDYREIRAIKEFADKNNICILLIHHTRKMKDSVNHFNEISGTNGIMGVSDTTFVISKEPGSNNSILHITGRDVDSSDWTITLNKQSCQWEYVGNTEMLSEQKRKAEYSDNPLTKTIHSLLYNKDEWKGKANEILKLAETLKLDLNMSSQAIGYALKDDDYIHALNKYDKIAYKRIEYKGSNANVHHFYYQRE